MNEYITNRIAHPGQYDMAPIEETIGQDNCATFVYKVLSAAGFDLKYSATPLGMEKNIRKGLKSIIIADIFNGAGAKGNVKNSGGGGDNILRPLGMAGPSDNGEELALSDRFSITQWPYLGYGGEPIGYGDANNPESIVQPGNWAGLMAAGGAGGNITDIGNLIQIH